MYDIDLTIHTEYFSAEIDISVADLTAETGHFYATWDGMIVCTYELNNSRALCCTLCSW